MSKSDALKATKAVAGLVAGHTVSTVVVTFVRQNTTSLTRSQEAQLYVGACVLGMMAADKAEQYAKAKIDELAEYWRKFKEQEKEVEA